MLNGHTLKTFCCQILEAAMCLCVIWRDEDFADVLSAGCRSCVKEGTEDMGGRVEASGDSPLLGCCLR